MSSALDNADLGSAVSRARDLLEDGSHADEVILLLCEAGVPRRGDVCALLASAYAQRGDTRGDLHAASFFAERALAAGYREPRLLALRERLTAEPHAGAVCHGRAPTHHLGGPADSRRDEPTPDASCALSRCLGTAASPKDLDWAARNVPCQAACPAGTDIPGYLTAVAGGDPDRAYRINLRDNVFPGVLGRVCARPCEAECRHGWEGLGQSVAICHAKRAAADQRQGGPVVLDPLFPPSGRRVAVVGAGPAGLACARDLALYGHGVTAFEKHVRPGGMMNQGIPEFRLPRSVVEAEIGQVRALGVDVRCGVAVGPDVSLQELLAEYDAVVMAAGTLRPNLLDLPGSSLQGIRHGLDFLLEVNETGGAKVGRRVAVIGGGFTAMDCARTAARLQRRAGLRDAEVRVWYRRSVSEMLITPGEIEELRHEGIPMEFMVSPMAYVGEAQRLSGLRLVRTRLGEPGADGRRRPLPIPGSEFEVQADTVLLATGQFPDTSWIDAGLRERLVGGDGWLRQGDSPRSVVPGLFVAGDFGGGASSLIQAIGHARSTAREVDALLMGPRRLGDRVRIADVRTTGRIREMDAVPQQPMPALALVDRDLRAEVETGFTQSTAVEESLRCYRCHLKFEIDPDRCIGCDWCLKVRPRPQCILRVRRVTADDQGRIVGWEEAARTQDTSFIWINQEDCIRCGACVAACPVDAISLQRVDRETGP